MSVFFQSNLRLAVLGLSIAVGGGGLIGLSSRPATALTVTCVNCSTIFNQLMEYVEAVDTQLNTARQLQTQIQQYANMVQQGLTLPDRVFNSITGKLQEVAGVYNSAQSIGRQVSNLDERFHQQFQGYQSYLNSTGTSASVMPGRYREWAEQGLDNARTALAAAGIHINTMSEEDAVLDQLVQRSSSASGRMQAIQAGNEIAAQNVQQLQRLRDLLATQVTLQSNYIAQEVERTAAENAFNERFRSGQIQGTGRDRDY